MSLLYTWLDLYHVHSYCLDLPQVTYIRTFALSGGGLGGDVIANIYVLPCMYEYHLLAVLGSVCSRSAHG
jgi:hypothetical protein